MCSIPGLPTPGSEVTFHVARVNLNPSCALVELWGEIDHERRHAYRKMKKEIQIPKVRFSESDGNSGDLCLAHLNGTWNRARIISRNGGNYNVFFIDEGRSHIATSSTLAWGQNNSFLLPPEVEFCVLANVSPISHENKWSPRATEYLKSLYDKTLTGLVHDVLMPDRTILIEIPAVSKYMYEVGFARKIPTDQFRVHVLSSLHLPTGEDAPTSERIHSKSIKQRNAGCELKTSQQYLYPELLTGTLETVEVTEMLNPLQIFCKLSIFSPELKKISEHIQEYYEGRSAFSKEQPQVSGSPCAVKGSNGKWYRSVLLQNLVSGCDVEVRHVDHGKTELVQEADIRPLDERFLRMPVVTYLCSLHGMKGKGTGWALNQVEYLKSVLLHQTVIAKFESYDLTEDIYYITLYGDEAVTINSLFKVKSERHEDSSLQNDMQFTISYDDESLDHFRNPFDLSVEPLEGSVNSLLCSEDLPLNVRKGDSSGVKIPSGSTTQVAKECSHPEKQDGVHLPQCSSPVKEKILDLHLFSEGTSVEVKVPYIESAAKFWCQLTEDSDSLELLMGNMQCYYDSQQLQQPVERLCVARHPDNRMWYRAWIVANHRSPIVDVRFIDYGHTRKVPLQDLRPIDPAFLVLKAQAFQCCLHNLIHPVFPDPDMSSDVATVKFHTFINLATSSNFKCTMNAVTHDSQGNVLHVVDLETPFQSACKLLTQQCKHDTATLKDSILIPVVSDAFNYSTQNIDIGGKERVLICSGGVSHFYGQLERNSHLLEELKENVQRFCQQLQSSVCPLVQNTVCFAKYTDNQWYRGHIKAKQPNLQVHFVDHGSTLTVNESDILPFTVEASTIRAVPVQAIPFGLSNVPEDVSPEVNSWFEKHATGHYFTVSVVEKCSSGKLMVELYDGTTNINMKVRVMLEEEKRRKRLSLAEENPIQDLTQHSSQSSKQTTSRGTDDAASREDCETQETERHSSFEMRKRDNASARSAKGMCLQSEQGTIGWPTSQSPISHSKPASYVAEHENRTSGILKITDLPPRLLKPGSVTEVYFSHSNSPSSFFVQLEKETSDIYSLVDKLNGSKSFCEVPVDPKELQLGDVVNAEYPEDSSWYRAVVRGKHEDGTVHVEFIDFGNEATISCLHIRQLDKQFAEFPRFSIPCMLDVGKQGKWDQDAVSMFKTMSEEAEKKFECTFIKETGSIWEVSLDGLILSEALVQQSGSNNAQLSCPEQSNRPNCFENKKPNISVGQREERPISHSKPASNVAEHENCTSRILKITDLPPRLLKPGSVTEVYFSHSNSPSSFFVQLEKETSDIYSLVDKLNGSKSFCEVPVDPKELQLGDVVNAEYPEDSSWYRAVVRGKHENGTVHVEFIDFGNEATISCLHIRQLDKQFAEFPRFSIPCMLDVGKQGKWDQDAVSMFKTMSEEAEKKFACTFIKETGSVWEVSLEDHGLILSEALVQQSGLNNAELSCPEQSNRPSCLQYKKPNISVGQTEEESPISHSKPASYVAEHENRTSGILKITDLPPRLLKPGSVTEVYFSHSNSPSSFFVQLEKETSDIYSLVDKLNGSKSFCEVPVDPKELQLGDVVNAEYPEDSSWYRAVVRGKHEDGTVHVEFIDFGNEATISCLHIRQLDKQFAEFPRFSIPCMLDVGKQGKWDQDAVSMFKTMSEEAEKKFECTFIKETGSIWEVSLDGLILSEALVQQSGLNNAELSCPEQSNRPNCLEYKKPNFSEGQTEEESPISHSKPASYVAEHENPTSGILKITDLPPRLLKPGSVTEVYFSHSNSPSSFFVQLEKETSDIYSLVDKLNGSKSFCEVPVDPKELQLGDVVNAEYPEDSSWYRAVVRGKHEDGTVHVEFIDFGNEATISCLHIRQLDKQFAEFPRFSIPCMLDVGKQGKWDQDAVSMFKTMSEEAEKKFECTFIKETGSVWEVSLEDHGLILSEALVQQCVSGLNNAELSCPEQSNRPSCLQYKKPNISVGQTEEVFASSISGPHFFWCQYANSDELNKISKLAQDVGNSAQEDVLFPDTLGPGSPCLALFAEDKIWYRARVIRKTGDMFTMRFVDYGNESDVDVKFVRSAPLSLMESTPQAFLCSLEGYEESHGAWDDNAADEFYHLLVDKSLRVTVRKIDVDVESQITQYKVKIECEVSVNEKMENYWKISTTKDTVTTYCNQHPYERQKQRTPKAQVLEMSESDFSSSAGRKLRR